MTTPKPCESGACIHVHEEAGIVHIRSTETGDSMTATPAEWRDYLAKVRKDEPQFATGGPVAPGRIVRVGEDTPPLIVPRINPQDRAQIQADAQRILADFGKALQQAMEPVRREFVRLSERYPKPLDQCGICGEWTKTLAAHWQTHAWIRRAWHWWVTAWRGHWRYFR